MQEEEDRSNMLPKDTTRCLGVHELIDWEIMQFRNVVDAYRLELSKQEGRYVGWKEAEKRFVIGDCVNVTNQWRVEYCGLVCPHRRSCMLAAHFLRGSGPRPFHLRP